MWKKFKTGLLALPAAALLSAFAAAPQESLTIRISNLRTNKGHVLISLFKDGEGYPDKPEKAFRKERLPINANQSIARFSSLPAGDYAIAILHDENDDLKMNTNFIGLPKEGYGFSNNVMGSFGPPSFHKAKFSIAPAVARNLEIRVNY
ncbi:MAG TPA: DUF2141 domain-containing protein [Chitinophagaceae bacterium]|nr:DUF2141 domain-containing protein [Chitinophagaceae bacterium]